MKVMKKKLRKYIFKITSELIYPTKQFPYTTAKVTCKKGLCIKSESKKRNPENYWANIISYTGKNQI